MGTFLIISLLIYVGLPFLVALPYWRQRQRLTSAAWFLGCTLLPVILAPIALSIVANSSTGDGGPGEGLGIAVLALIGAATLWLILCITAFLCAPILRDERE